MASPPQWRAVLKQGRLEWASSEGWGACWDGVGQSVRAPGSFYLTTFACPLAMAAFALFSGRVRSRLAPFSLSVFSLFGNGRLCLSGELPQSKRVWSRPLVWAGMCTMVALGNWQETQAVFNLFALPYSLE